MPLSMPSSVRELRKESRSASRFTGRRVHFIGIGEGVEDLAPFTARDFSRAIAGME